MRCGLVLCYLYKQYTAGEKADKSKRKTGKKYLILGYNRFILLAAE